MNEQVKILSPSKKRIYETASQLFGSNGYAATTVRDIAKEVGLEVSSLYSHISSKQEILVDICFGTANRFLHGLNQISHELLDPVEILRAIIDMHVEIAASEPTSILVFNDEWKHLADHDLNRFVKMRKAYELKVEEFIQRGISDQCIIDRNPITLMNTLLSALKWVYFAKEEGQKERVKETLELVLLHGMVR